MNRPMFCYQCEQTAVANLQDQLTGALIGLARAADTNAPTASTHRAVIEGLFTTLTNVNFNEETVLQQLDAVRREKAALTVQPAHPPAAEPTNTTFVGELENIDK